MPSRLPPIRAALLVLAAIPRLAYAGDEARVVDLAAERRLVVTIDAAALEAVAVADGGSDVAVRLPRTAVLYRFRGELVDRSGRPVAGPVAWTMTVHAPEVGAAAVVRLSEDRSLSELPRPFGLGVRAGDPLRVVAGLPDVAGDWQVRLSVEYERPDDAGRRLPALALAAAAGASGALEFAATTDARLVAVGGPWLDGAAEVIIEDAARGEIVWRQQMPGAMPGAAGTTDPVVRPGIAVVAGRAYRLRVLTGRADRAAGGDASLILVPVR